MPCSAGHLDRALEELLGIEGGFSDDPADSGGATRYGITEGLARDMGYFGEMNELPAPVARHIYKVVFWDEMWLDTIAPVSFPLAFQLFESAVNVDVGRSTRWLQRSLNALNNREAYYDDIGVDGVVGPITVTAFKDYLRVRGVEEGSQILSAAHNALQGSFYIELSERRAKDERFLYGWIKQRVVGDH